MPRTQLPAVTGPTELSAHAPRTTPFMTLIDFEVRGDHIALDSLLKATGLAPSGGVAKAMIAAGAVEVDGREELRKTCKLRAGQTVQLAGSRIRLLAAGGAA